MKKMNQAKIKELKKAILDLHGCKSKWVESVSIKEVFKGETAWEGIIDVFDLQGHSMAKRAYAWSHDIEGSTKKKFYAVLHQGKIDSPEKAIKAAIVQEFRLEPKKS